MQALRLLWQNNGVIDMTYKQKIKELLPNEVNEKYDGEVRCCPGYYFKGAVKTDGMGICPFGDDCDACWNQQVFHDLTLTDTAKQLLNKGKPTIAYKQWVEDNLEGDVYDYLSGCPGDLFDGALTLPACKSYYGLTCTECWNTTYTGDELTDYTKAKLKSKEFVMSEEKKYLRMDAGNSFWNFINTLLSNGYRLTITPVMQDCRCKYYDVEIVDTEYIKSMYVESNHNTDATPLLP